MKDVIEFKARRRCAVVQESILSIEVEPWMTDEDIRALAQSRAANDTSLYWEIVDTAPSALLGVKNLAEKAEKSEETTDASTT